MECHSSGMDKKRKLMTCFTRRLAEAGGDPIFIDLQELIQIFSCVGSTGVRNPESFFSDCGSIHCEKSGDHQFEFKLKPDFSICPDYAKHGNCKETVCKDLHLCLYHLYDECKFNKKCRLSHDFFDVHNSSILRRNFMEDLKDQQIAHILLKLNLVARPLICKWYNGPSECKFGSECTCLHLCSFYINDRCSYKEKCKRSHDLNDATVRFALVKRGFDINQETAQILCDIRTNLGIKNYSKSSNPCLESSFTGTITKLSINTHASSEQNRNNTDDSPLICTFYLRNKCLYKTKCTKFHQPNNLPYHWQYQNMEKKWLDLPHNKEIERGFCNCEEKIKIHLGVDWKIMDLNQMELETHEKVRRLSTEPQKIALKEFKFLTLWNWFWCEDERKKVWINYQAKDDYPSSEILERAFQKDVKTPYQFKTQRWTYIIDFEKMVQTNEITQKIRRVMRRSDLFDEVMKMPKSISNLKDIEDIKSKIDIPKHWSGVFREFGSFHLVDVPPHGLTVEEFCRINTFFKETTNTNIKTLKRIENLELWKLYTTKLDSLKIKGENRSTVKQLFHGTHREYLEAICHQGFDFRLSGTSYGTSYGKGSYFARDASYSIRYSDCKKVFIANVIVGEFVKGKPNYVRPPLRNDNDPTQGTYESCVNREQDPSIFVVFDNYQSYPEYLVEYY